MKIKIIFTGKTQNGYVKEGLSEFVNRLKNYAKLEILETEDLKNTRSLEPEQIKQKEAEKQLAMIEPGDKLVLLDEKGKLLTSRQLAGEIEKDMNQSTRCLVLLIGGPFGFHEDLHKRSTWKLSLSPMTFPHQMVRLILAEQLYRAFSILNNEPYHHD